LSTRAIKRDHWIICNELGAGVHKTDSAFAIERQSLGRPARLHGLIGPVIGAALLAAAFHQAALAQSAPQFALPIDCRVHVDCWIVNYFDADPGPGARDYTGGYRTYDNHRGTDFAIRSLAAMNAGVPVLAAADGIVRARRDGMNDVNVEITGPQAVKGRECGNGVVIGHGPGWATQYCHMRKGSVRVHKGQAVKSGDVLGFVGISGLAAFPHVHFNIFKDKKRVDPFAPDPGSAPLWRIAASKRLNYERVSIYAVGFREAVPDSRATKLGTIESQAVSVRSPAILFWTGIFGIRAGDHIKQSLTGPDGRVLATREIEQKKNQIRRFLWIGKKRPALPWPAGEYTGRIVVTPGDAPESEVYVKELRIEIGG